MRRTAAVLTALILGLSVFAIYLALDGVTERLTTAEERSAAEDAGVCRVDPPAP